MSISRQANTPFLLRRERMKNLRKLTQNLKKKIISLIEEDWSPQQIKGRLMLGNQPFVSHEAIYKIFVDWKIKNCSSPTTK